MSNIARLQRFVADMTRLVEQGPMEEPQVLAQADALMSALVAQDDWLPAEMAQPHPQFYQQHLLYGDPLDRFSLVSFVWGPGQFTPVHDHMTWGLIGMLRGSEYSQSYVQDADGRVRPEGAEVQLQPGQVERVSPTIGDIHRVRNALDDQVSISIHLYGGNIGRIQRHVFVPDTGEVKDFVSGYSNTLVPNLWPKVVA